MELGEWVAMFLEYAVWALFGFLFVSRLDIIFVWQSIVFAVLALTVLRMVPVAVVLIGTGWRRQSVLFVGWFGPRGLASVVFALLAIESLPHDAALDSVVGAIAATVLLSVILHGVTADPWARRYGAWVAAHRPTVECEGSVEPLAGRLAERVGITRFQLVQSLEREIVD